MAVQGLLPQQQPSFHSVLESRITARAEQTDRGEGPPERARGPLKERGHGAGSGAGWRRGTEMGGGSEAGDQQRCEEGTLETGGRRGMLWGPRDLEDHTRVRALRMESCH